jgi:hypothetical protein
MLQKRWKQYKFLKYIYSINHKDNLETKTEECVYLSRTNYPQIALHATKFNDFYTYFGWRCHKELFLGFVKTNKLIEENEQCIVLFYFYNRHLEVGNNGQCN